MHLWKFLIDILCKQKLRIIFLKHTDSSIDEKYQF